MNALALADVVEIRRALPADVPALVACDAHAQAHIARQEALQAWALAGAILLAESGARVRGFVVLEHGLFGHGFIPLLGVAPDARRQGLALRLLGAAEAACRTAKLFTSSNASNAAARALFERAGFVRSGTIENLDAGDPELVYFKAVPEAADAPEPRDR